MFRSSKDLVSVLIAFSRFLLLLWSTALKMTKVTNLVFKIHRLQMPLLNFHKKCD